MSNNKNKTKKIATIIIIAVIGVVVLFLSLANFIVLDECASPCRNTEAEVCAAVCERVTLMDWILGNG